MAKAVLAAGGLGGAGETEKAMPAIRRPEKARRPEEAGRTEVPAPAAEDPRGGGNKGASASSSIVVMLV